MTPTRPSEDCPACHEPIDFGASDDIVAAPHRGRVAIFHVTCLEDRHPEPINVSQRMGEILEDVTR